jgi:hypothetical protein
MKKQLIAISLGAVSTVASQASLVAHYNMEQGSTPLVDQAGGQTADALGSGHSYAVGGPAGFGTAVALTGNGSWQISAANSQELNLANNFTVASWIYLDSATIAGKTGTNNLLNRIIGDDAAWDADGWSFGVFNDGRVRFTKNGVIDADIGTVGAVSTNTWVHLAATISSTTGTTVYVNGAPIGSNANLANLNTGLGNNGVLDPFAIGRSYGGAEAQWFAGRLDEVRVYDTVLSQSEIQGLMVPEPSAALLASLASLGFAFRRRR